MEDHDYITDVRLSGRVKPGTPAVTIEKADEPPQDSWETRLYYEHEELCDRIDRLGFHISSLVVNMDTIEDLYIMVYQLDAMKKYRDYLEARAALHDIELSRFSKSKPYSDEDPQF